MLTKQPIEPRIHVIMTFTGAPHQGYQQLSDTKSQTHSTRVNSSTYRGLGPDT
jgi:hypothetical protein